MIAAMDNEERAAMVALATSACIRCGAYDTEPETCEHCSPERVSARGIPAAGWGEAALDRIMAAAIREAASYISDRPYHYGIPTDQRGIDYIAQISHVAWREAEAERAIGRQLGAALDRAIFSDDPDVGPASTAAIERGWAAEWHYYRVLQDAAELTPA